MGLWFIIFNMSIHLLPTEIASQIAAGEVVERPASVIKECIENAIDAGATVISIRVAESGKSMMEVTDNGSGISFEELPLSVQRHATSKLDEIDDLFHISSLGFRGEALASIGSISRLTLISRRPDKQNGGKLVVEGGELLSHAAFGCPVGTSIRVENLFYNVPARLKFLKTDVTERRMIDVIIAKYALAYPTIRFQFTDDRGREFITSGNGDMRAVLASLFDVDTAKQMLEVISEENDLRLRGFISPAHISRSNRREITFFINGRWVADTPLSQAVMQAYNTFMMVGRYPIVCMDLWLEPSNVDVNVHPTKAEVRFKDQDRVFSFVQRSIKRALFAYAPVPSFPSTQRFWGKPEGVPNWLDNPQNNPENNLLEWQITQERDVEIQSQTDNRSESTPEFETGEHEVPLIRHSMFHLIGQVGATYIIAEGIDGIYLIDQHAAHERILFEQLMRQFSMRDIPSQVLLTPSIVELSLSNFELVSSQINFLSNLGFEIQPFGSTTFQIRSMPAIFANKDPALVINSIIEDFEEDETPLQADFESRIAGRVCKRMAIKGGQILSREEQQLLLDQLENCENPRTCPHGRPTMIHLSVDLLEKQFGRRGAI